MKVRKILVLLLFVLGVIIAGNSCKATRTITTTAKAVPTATDTMLISTEVVEMYDGMIRR